MTANTYFHKNKFLMFPLFEHLKGNSPTKSTEVKKIRPNFGQICLPINVFCGHSSFLQIQIFFAKKLFNDKNSKPFIRHLHFF